MQLTEIYGRLINYFDDLYIYSERSKLCVGKVTFPKSIYLHKKNPDAVINQNGSKLETIESYEI